MCPPDFNVPMEHIVAVLSSGAGVAASVWLAAYCVSVLLSLVRRSL